MLAARKREIREANRLSVAETRQERAMLQALMQAARESERAIRTARKAEIETARDTARIARENTRVTRARLKAQKSKRHRQVNTFQPFMFRLSRVPSPSKVFKDALSLDAPLKTDRRFGAASMADTAVDPAPSVLERMIAAEGVQRVVHRLSSEKGIPLEQARQIVEALVDSDLLEDEGICNLADLLRGGWQTNRLLSTKSRQPITLATKPMEPNPKPSQYEHWRRRYGLQKSGRVIVRDTMPISFGGAWSVETALPEEVEKVT